MTNYCTHIKPVFGVRERRRFDKSVHCEKCRKILEYEIGSITWETTDIDVCAGCAGKKAAQKSIKELAKEHGFEDRTPEERRKAFEIAKDK